MFNITFLKEKKLQKTCELYVVTQKSDKFFHYFSSLIRGIKHYATLNHFYLSKIIWKKLKIDKI